jgi:putative FmdB family regulatory protein
MPIYEYECVKCAGRVEALIRNDRDIPTACGKCGGQLKKAFSGFSVPMAAAGPRHEPSAACASCPSSGCPHSGH